MALANALSASTATCSSPEMRVEALAGLTCAVAAVVFDDAGGRVLSAGMVSWEDAAGSGWVMRHVAA